MQIRALPKDLWWLQTEPKASEVLSGTSIKQQLVITLISFEEGTTNTSQQHVEIKGEAQQTLSFRAAQGVG